MRAGVGHQPKAMEDPTARGARAQGGDRVHSASWGNPRDEGRAGGRLEPEIKVTIGGDRPPRLSGDVVTFEDMRGFLVVYSEYEQHKPRWRRPGTCEEARAGRFGDSMMVADEFYDGKPWVDLSEEELMQGLKTFVGVDMQQTSDEDFCGQIFRVLKMDASVPVDSKVFRQKRALRKNIADSGLTEVMRPDGR